MRYQNFEKWLLATLTSGYPDWGFSVLFHQLWGKCQGIPCKDGARSALFLISELCFFMYCLCRLCCSVYCLCRLCCSMYCSCTVLLPPGVNPTAVKYIISYVCGYVRPSVLMEQFSSHWMDFHEIWYLRIFSKFCWENSSFIKIWQE
jgi:hypothetical protein